MTGAAGATVDTIRVSADGNTLYAALTTVADSALMVIDLRSGRIAHRVAIRGSIGDIAAHRDGRRVFVTGWDVERGRTLTVVDAVSGRVTGTVALGGPATQVVLSGTRAYVVSGDDVSVVDIVAALRVVDTFEIGRPVSCVALSRDRVLPLRGRLRGFHHRALRRRRRSVARRVLNRGQRLQSSDTVMLWLVTTGTRKLPSRLPSPGPTHGTHWVTVFGFRTLVTMHLDIGPVPILSSVTV